MLLMAAVSQMYGQIDLRFGLKGGPNFAKLNVDDDDIDTESITQFHAGVYGTIKVTKFAVQPEVLFSRQGSEDVDGLETTLDYINIPVMAKFYVITGLHFEVGPQIGFLLNGEQETLDINGNIRETDIDFGVGFGTGCDLPFGLVVGARYVLGITDVNDFESPGFDVPELTNRVLMVSVWYALKK